MNFTQRKKPGSSFLIRDILRVSSGSSDLVPAPGISESGAAGLLTRSSSSSGSSGIRTQAGNSSSCHLPQPAATHRDDGFMMMISSPSGDCFGAGDGPAVLSNSFPSLCDAYLASVKLPHAARFYSCISSNSSLPPAPAFDHVVLHRSHCSPDAPAPASRHIHSSGSTSSPSSSSSSTTAAGVASGSANWSPARQSVATASTSSGPSSVMHWSPSTPSSASSKF